MNKYLRASLILITSISLSQAALADLKKGNGNGNGEKKSETASQLRCWQNGKLLFDESDWDSKQLDNLKSAIKFSQGKSSNKDAYVINFRETVCLFKQ